jgi:hypothetical protein
MFTAIQQAVEHRSRLCFAAGTGEQVAEVAEEEGIAGDGGRPVKWAILAAR